MKIIDKQGELNERKTNHRKPSSSIMGDLEVLVFKSLSVDGLSTGSITTGEVSS